MASQGGGSQERALFYAKVWYSIYFGSLAFAAPFLNLFLERQGFSARQIGLIAALRPWIGAVTASGWCSLADARRCHRPVFLALFVLSTILLASLGLKATPFLWALAVILAAQCLNAAVPILADAVVNAATTNEHQYGRCRLWGAVFWGGVSLFSGLFIENAGFRAAFAVYLVTATAGVPVLLYGLDFSFLQTDRSRPDRKKPARAKVHASTDRLALLSQQDRSSSAPAHVRRSRDGRAGSVAIEMAEVAEAAPLSSLCLEAGDPGERLAELQGLLEVDRGGAAAAAAEDGDAPFAEKLKRLLAPHILLFLFQSVLMGFGMGTFTGFLFIYLDELGASEALMSLSVTLTCVAEVPVFHFAGRILDKLGFAGAIDLVLAAFVVRLTAYATMASWPSLWLVLAVEPLHGLTYGLAWAAGTAFSKRAAPPGLEATMQSTFHSSYFGLGTGLGALVGGATYDGLGPAACFATAALVVLAGGALSSLPRLWPALQGRGQEAAGR